MLHIVHHTVHRGNLVGVVTSKRREEVTRWDSVLLEVCASGLTIRASIRSSFMTGMQMDLVLCSDWMR